MEIGILFGIGIALVLVVGFVGNKITDGIGNGIRSRKVHNQNRNINEFQKSNRIETVENEAVITEKKNSKKLSASICSSCGVWLKKNAVFWPNCGEKIKRDRR